MIEHQTVRAEQAGRLDAVVSTAFEIGRRQAARIVKAGGVLVDGKRIRVPSEKVTTGQALEMNPEARLSDQPLQILHENDDVWVVAKPAGIPT
ncbi:MAG: hypothetical protein CMH53_06910, partial [Myxococcales bacterium]|nr:hypothetical protein [Myxococcales bacterium]